MSKKNKKIAVIGSGFSGLSTAAYLAKAGYDVSVFEKNSSIGGRARMFETDGFKFDMGPSWYWMPDVFERFYNQFGHTTSDFYTLKRLDPSYRVFWQESAATDVPADYNQLIELFESYDKGSGKRLKKFLDEAAYKYQVGINELVYKPSLSITEFFDWRLLMGLIKMDVLKNMASHVRKVTHQEQLVSILEFPTLFLGALPENTPALYSLMNYADLVLGTWYPEGGMFEIVKAMKSICDEHGVKFYTSKEVISFKVEKNLVTQVEFADGSENVDGIVSSADYAHTEKLLPLNARNYSDQYWDKRVMAPSSLLFYLGLNKKVDGLLHHNLFFDRDFKNHSHQIYTDPQWPTEPLFYVSVTSKTDKSVAPDGCENVFILIPLASGLEDSIELREKYFNIVAERIKHKIGIDIREHVIYKKSFAMNDFVSDYHAFKGNAYGLANTLKQTAILKPSIKNKKLKNFFYTGQLTVPGPGVPPSIISGEVAAGLIVRNI